MMRNPVTVTQAGSPGLHKEKVQLQDDIRLLNIDFLRSPSRELADTMAAKYERIIEIDKAIVMTNVTKKLLDLVGDTEEIEGDMDSTLEDWQQGERDAGWSEFEESPHGY